VPGGGEVLVVNVKPGVSTTDQRQAGFEAAAKESADEPRAEAVTPRARKAAPAPTADPVVAAQAAPEPAAEAVVEPVAEAVVEPVAEAEVAAEPVAEHTDEAEPVLAPESAEAGESGESA
jgi:ABC-type sugar transport system substrate-binding protein